MVNKAIKYIEIRPAVFRTYKVLDNWGTRSFKTYLEATDHMILNKDKWNITDRAWRQGEEYGYQIRVIEETIIVIDGEHYNPLPE